MRPLIQILAPIFLDIYFVGKIKHFGDLTSHIEGQVRF